MLHTHWHNEGIKVLDAITKQMDSADWTTHGYLRVICKALAVIIGILLSH